MAQRIVGLDIGTSAVRAVELTVDAGRTPVLEAFGQVGLPAGVVVDGEVRDRGLMTAAIRRLWREGGFTGRHVYLGVAGTRAITREMDLPPIPPSELDDAVRLQADEVVPFPSDRTAISSSVTGQYTDDEGAPHLRVLAAAAHRDLIDAVVGAVEDADLQPVGIDLHSAALARALRGPATEGPEIVVSVGAGLTVVTAHQGGVVLFVRTIDLGGDTATEAIAGALDLPTPDAEIIKRRLGHGSSHDDPQALSAAAGVVDELVGEIHSSVRFFSTLPGRSAPDRVLVTGAGSRTVGLLDRLEERMDVPVERAAALSAVDASRLPISEGEAASIDPAIAVSVGLALPAAGGTQFNLLPSEVTARYAEHKARRVLVLCAIALVVLLAGATAWRVLAVRTAEHRLTSLKSQLHVIQTVEIPRYDKAVRLASQATTLENQLRPLVAHEVDWLVVFSQLGQYLTPTAVLSSVKLQATSTPLRPGSSSTATSSATTSSTGTNTKPAIGTGNATITVDNFAKVTTFGNTFGGSPVLFHLTLTGSLSTSGSITFPATFDIGQAASSQRLGLFSQKLP